MAEVRILEQTETGEKGPPPTAKWLTYLIEAGILLVAVLLIWLVRASWLEPMIVTSNSMQNTLQVGERFLVDHRRSLSGSWRRGDIVLLETRNGEWGEDTLVKRVIGLPGERVEIVDGQILIDGKVLAENYLREKPQPEDHAARVLAGSEYYVLGDNRNFSEDSRDHGPVSNGEIRGRVTRKLWPWQILPVPSYGF